MGNQKGRACGGEDDLLRRKFSLALHHQCCPPLVSAPFLRALVLSTVNARSVSPCPSAVHRQLPFCSSVHKCVHRQLPFCSSVPQCCPPSVSVPFIRVLKLRARGRQCRWCWREPASVFKVRRISGSSGVTGCEIPLVMAVA